MKGQDQRTDEDRVSVRLRGVSKAYGTTQAVHPLDLDIRKGEFLALLGPSGCGKTTLLNLIGGFTHCSTGTIEISGEEVTRLGPERRRTNMVFQGYGLFPHMTVRQNIAYGLRIAKVPKADIDERVNRAIRLIHLDGMEDRLPAALSGGQQQRVALARALVMEPTVLLLDESLSALDLKLRKSMQNELRQLHREIGGTFVFVTHDQGEAMALASRIAVMKDGKIVQQGTPDEIYANPATEFVADFIGEANILRGRRQSDKITLEAGATFPNPGQDDAIVMVLRPEDAVLFDPKGATPDTVEFFVEGRVLEFIFLGMHDQVSIELSSGQTIVAHIPPRHAAPSFHPGNAVNIGWSADTCRIIEAK